MGLPSGSEPRPVFCRVFQGARRKKTFGFICVNSFLNRKVLLVSESVMKFYDISVKRKLREAAKKLWTRGFIIFYLPKLMN